MLSKKAKPPPVRSSGGPRSAEFIENSDDLDELPARPSVKKTVSFNQQVAVGVSRPLARKKRTKSKILPSRAKLATSSSESEDEDGVNGEEGTSRNGSEGQLGSRKKEERSTESEEEDAESEDGSASTTESTISTKPKLVNGKSPARSPGQKVSYIVQQVNGVKRKADETGSKNPGRQNESESGDDEGEDIEDQAKSSEEGDESSSTESSENNAITQSVPTKKPLKEFEPPRGFETASVSFPSSSEAASFFRLSNLEGKQIWHITAPVRLPIKSIKEISAQSAQDGSFIHRYKRTEYGLGPQARETNETLLLPSEQHNAYEICRVPISNILHLQQIVRLPDEVTRPNSLANAIENADGPRNQQPTNLMMRFHAFGTSSSSDTDSDSNLEARNQCPFPLSVTQFERPPVVVQPPSSSKKRPFTETHALSQSSEPLTSKARKTGISPETAIVNGIHGLDSECSPAKAKSPEKTKKPKHDKTEKEDLSNTTNDNGSELTEIDNPIEFRNSKVSSKDKKDRPNGLPSSVPATPKEAAEQKATRKEERRQQRTQESTQKLATDTSTSKPQHHSSSVKAKSTKPALPLAEFSARLAATEEQAEREKVETPHPAPPARSAPTQKTEEERARRKEEKRLRRATAKAASSKK